MGTGLDVGVLTAKLLLGRLVYIASNTLYIADNLNERRRGSNRVEHGFDEEFVGVLATSIELRKPTCLAVQLWQLKSRDEAE